MAFEFNAEETDEFFQFLEDYGYIVERIHAPMQYREDLGHGLVKHYHDRVQAMNALRVDVRDKVFFLGVWTEGKERAIRFVLASEFRK
jgi:hypothetical protein